MYKRFKLFAAFGIFLLTSMCTFYDQTGAIISPNGLSCQTRTDYQFLTGQQSAECYYQCPDGTLIQQEIAEGFSEASPLYTASKEQLDAQLCSASLQPTPTLAPATEIAMEVAASTEVATNTATEQAAPSPTAEAQVTGEPLLRGDVSMCDVASNLINFRMVSPAPDLSGRTLAVQIADRDTTCSVNQVNTSLLTCDIPRSVFFPARVAVRLDGVLVNDFVYDGLGCAKIATQFPTPAP